MTASFNGAFMNASQILTWLKPVRYSASGTGYPEAGWEALWHLVARLFTLKETNPWRKISYESEEITTKSEAQ